MRTLKTPNSFQDTSVCVLTRVLWQQLTAEQVHTSSNKREIHFYLWHCVYEIYRLVLLLPHLYEWISQWKSKIQCTTARNLRVGFLGYAIEIEYNLVFNSQASQLLYWQEWKIIQEFDGEKCGIRSFHSVDELNGMKSAVTDQIRWTLFNWMLSSRKLLDYSFRQSICGIQLLFRENMPKNLHFRKKWIFSGNS